MAPPKKDKKKFDWSAGCKLSSENYEPVGEVREVGFNKLADGLPADPVRRREDRKAKLSRKALPKKPGETVFEESESGLKGEFTPSESYRLIDKGRELKGIQRFNKKSPGKPKSK